MGTKRKGVEVTDELVALFKAALPAYQALWQEIITSKRVMSDEKEREARAAVQAFDQVAGVLPFEHSPLSPRSDGPGSLRSALLAKVNGVEAKAWRRFARKWWKQHNADIAAWNKQQITPARAKAAITEARRRLKLDPVS